MAAVSYLRHSASLHQAGLLPASLSLKIAGAGGDDVIRVPTVGDAGQYLRQSRS